MPPDPCGTGGTPLVAKAPARGTIAAVCDASESQPPRQPDISSAPEGVATFAEAIDRGKGEVPHDHKVVNERCWTS